MRIINLLCKLPERLAYFVKEEIMTVLGKAFGKDETNQGDTTSGEDELARLEREIEALEMWSSVDRHPKDGERLRDLHRQAAALRGPESTADVVAEIRAKLGAPAHQQRRGIFGRKTM